MIIVSDTSVLSGLAIVGQLNLLQQLYGQVLIPPAVVDELRRGGEDDQRITSVLVLEWIEVCQPSDRLLIEILQNEHNLDRGESEAISLALELKVEELLIDEPMGRREAVRLGLSIIGLLGILLLAKNRGLVIAVRPIMDNLIADANFWVSDRLYTSVLRAAAEDTE